MYIVQLVDGRVDLVDVEELEVVEGEEVFDSQPTLASDEEDGRNGLLLDWQVGRVGWGGRVSGDGVVCVFCVCVCLRA